MDRRAEGGRLAKRRRWALLHCLFKYSIPTKFMNLQYDSSRSRQTPLDIYDTGYALQYDANYDLTIAMEDGCAERASACVRPDCNGQRTIAL